MITLRHPLILLGIALALGVSADLLFYGRAPGLSAPLFTALLLTALATLSSAEARPPTALNRWIGAVALFFAAWIAVRTSLLLITLNTIAVLGLLLLHVTLYRAESLRWLESWRIGAGLALASLEAAFLPMPLAWGQTRRLFSRSDRGRELLVLARGLMLAAPVLLIFTGLLAMADSIFASYVTDLLNFRLPFDIDTLVPHLLLIGVVAWGAASGLVLGLREHQPGSLLGPRVVELPAEGDTQRLRATQQLQFLGAGEALTVLGLVDALFACFMLIQGAYLFGGLDTLERTGMTFAEYARRGFFELVAVACLALGLLWLAALLTRRDQLWQRRAFNAACAAMVALVLSMLASAAFRMWLYEQAYGFSTLRLLTHSFMAWLAVVLLLFIAALLRDRSRLFSMGVPITAAIYLAVLNLINPDAMIVRENVARYQATADLDMDYLTTLSPDAAPQLAAALPLIGPHRTQAERHLWEIRQELANAAARDGWQGWQLGRARATAAIDAALGEAAPGPQP